MHFFTISLSVLFTLVSNANGTSAVDRAEPDSFPPHPYWCATVKLQKKEGVVPARKSSKFTGRFVDEGPGCKWKGYLLSAKPLLNAKELNTKELQTIVIFGKDCAKLKKGQELSGVIGGSYLSGWRKENEGTLKNSAAYFAGCDCPTEDASNPVVIPKQCDLQFPAAKLISK